MRDVPGLTPILERAAMESGKGPRFRFHGREFSANRERTPLLDRAPGGSVKDGVATLRLYEPIDSWGGPWGVSALEFLETFDQLPDDISEVRLHINSPGGEVWEALAILNTLRQFDARLVAVVDGIAASAASFIACAADETIMGKNAQLMIHDASGICIGNAAEMHQYADLLDKVSENIANIYADKSGQTVSSIRAAMIAETWYSDTEAVAAGLADSVAGEELAEDAPPADEFDLTGVGAKYAGRAEAPPPPIPSQSASAIEERRQRMQARRHALNARKASTRA